MYASPLAWSHINACHPLQRSSTTRAESRSPPKSGGGSDTHTEPAASDARRPEQRNTVRLPAGATAASSGSSRDACEVGGCEAGTTGSSTPHQAVTVQDLGLPASSSMRQHKTAAPAGPTSCLAGGNAAADAMRSCDDIGLKGYATT